MGDMASSSSGEMGGLAIKGNEMWVSNARFVDSIRPGSRRAWNLTTMRATRGWRGSKLVRINPQLRLLRASLTVTQRPLHIPATIPAICFYSRRRYWRPIDIAHVEQSAMVFIFLVVSWSLHSIMTEIVPLHRQPQSPAEPYYC